MCVVTNHGENQAGLPFRVDSALLFVMSDVIFIVLVRDLVVLPVVQSQNGQVWQAYFAVAAYVARAEFLAERTGLLHEEFAVFCRRACRLRIFLRFLHVFECARVRSLALFLVVGRKKCPIVSTDPNPLRHHFYDKFYKSLRLVITASCKKRFLHKTSKRS
jgi:hypothetical protein